MNQIDLIKELRLLTSAGMKDCKEALEEANWDLQKAVDIIKVKGQAISDSRSGRVASEGIIIMTAADKLATMVECNCQTDFVAQSKDFILFTALVSNALFNAVKNGDQFDVSSVEDTRQTVAARTKENIVVRRWWAEEALSPNVRVFHYKHSNHKLGVLLSLQITSLDKIDDSAFCELGDNLCMQIAAMNPLATSVEHLAPTDVDRQKAIFETQLQELNKPQAAWPKIMEGKMRKWHSEVCLLEQESVIVPKTTVAQTIKDVEKKLGTTISIVNFVRCQVGEGLEKKQDDLGEEVNKLIEG